MFLPFLFFGSAAFGLGTGATAGAILADIAIGTMLYGTQKTMQAQQQQTDAARAVYDYNAEARRRDAAQIRRAGIEEQRTVKDEMHRLLKRQRVLYAKGKIQMEGSPLAVQLDTIEEYSEELSRLTESYDIATSRAMSGSILERYKSDAAKRAGKLAAQSTLFGGLSSVASLGISYQLQRA